MSLSIEALKHRPQDVKEVILSDKANKNSQLSYLLELCEKNGIEPVYDDRMIEKLSLKENCYCIAVFNKFNSDLSADEHLLLYRFSDYGDLGTIIRSAVSFDFRDIVLIGSDIDYFDPRCIRASMGSIFHCNIVRYASIDEYRSSYPQFNVYPFVSDSGKELDSLELKRPYAILISQDYHGLDGMDGYYIEHRDLSDISLSIRSSIILQKVFSLKS